MHWDEDRYRKLTLFDNGRLPNALHVTWGFVYIYIYIWNKLGTVDLLYLFSQSRLRGNSFKCSYFHLLSILPGSLPYFLIIYKSKRVNFLGLVTSIRKTKHTNYTGLFTTVKLTLSWLWVLIFILSLPTHLTDNLQVSHFSLGACQQGLFWEHWLVNTRVQMICAQ